METHIPLPTDNPATTTVATTSVTAVTPVTIDMNTEVTRLINETIKPLLNQLAEAREEITDLRHIAYHSEVRAHDYGLRMLTAENTLRQLVLLHPTPQNTNPSDNNLTPLTAQSRISTKRTLGETSNNSPPEPRAKKAKTVKANATNSEREQNYAGNKPYCTQCKHHHKGSCGAPCKKCQLFGHRARNCNLPAKGANSNASKVCFECGDTGHFRNGCPQMKNNNLNSTTGTSYTMTRNSHD